MTRTPGRSNATSKLATRTGLAAWQLAALLASCALFSGACSSTSPLGIQAGRSEKVMMDEKFKGVRRSYRLHLPSDLSAADDRPRPLVVVLHGGIASGKIVERQSAFSELADREGFLVLYPNGVGLPGGLLRHWNGGWCCGKAHQVGLDDLGFVMRTVEDVAAHYPVDERRVYVVGYSNGGMLAYQIASQRSDRVAGLGIFASAVGVVEPDGEPGYLPERPETPVPAVLVHGTGDPRLDYDGRANDKRGVRTLGAQESAAWWAEANGCREEGEESVVIEGALSRVEWCEGLATDVVLYSVDDWGHDWPGPPKTDRLPASDPRRGLDAAELMWRFFERAAR